MLTHLQRRFLSATRATMTSNNCVYPSLQPPKDQPHQQRLHHLPPDTKPTDVMRDFYSTVNMSVDEMEEWLNSEASHTAIERAETEEEKEGRHLARRVIELLKNKRPESDASAGDYPGTLMYEGDFEHMHQITDYIRCRKAELKQHPPPPGGATDSLQRLQLMNLGYDPLKDSEVADCWTYNSI